MTYSGRYHFIRDKWHFLPRTGCGLWKSKKTRRFLISRFSSTEVRPDFRGIHRVGQNGVRTFASSASSFSSCHRRFGKSSKTYLNYFNSMNRSPQHPEQKKVPADWTACADCWAVHCSWLSISNFGLETDQNVLQYWPLVKALTSTVRLLILTLYM